MRLQPVAVPGPEGRAIQLRSPTESDAAAMLTFLRELVQESSEYLEVPVEQFDAESVESQAARLARTEAHGHEFYLAAFDDDRVVGNLLFQGVDASISRHCGQLAMGVLQSHQGLGLASALLRRCIDEAGALGRWNIRFTVRTYNHRAIALYERHGFRRVGRLESVAQVGDSFVDEFLYQGLFGR